ncbi:MAG TPA: hypothetical protein VF557_04030 [Jatrophihabitans sp.]|jgi:sugar lactone lactonase YvrE|uniref:hypothetical protein n=1 Tax=Jatrophihabitans sp. TaxID=1932789 RepID=UPI002F1EB16A
MTSGASALPVEGDQLCGLAWLDGLLWYSDAGLEAITAVDPVNGAVVTRLPCPGVRTGLTAADGGTRLVQVVDGDKRLRVLEPYTGRVFEEYPNPRPGAELCGVHDTPGGMWMGYQDPPVIDLRRHGDHEAILSIEVNEDVADVTVAGGSVIFANHPEARLNVLDPESGRIVRVIPVAGNPTGLTWDGRRLWYCDYSAGQLRAVEVDLDELTAGSEDPVDPC